MACAICETRRPRRFCPGVQGDICTLCCGEQREISVDCPLTCEYLQEAHRHEKTQPPPWEDLPNRDVDVSEEFLAKHEEFLIFMGQALSRTSLEWPELIDFDVREALEAAIRTHRTMQSGLVYQSLPSNPLAAKVCLALLEAAEAFRRAEFEKLGIHRTRESIALHLLVFLQHLEMSFNNGRRRGRAFIGALVSFYPVDISSPPTDASSLLLP